jgi:hypothetical protein
MYQKPKKSTEGEEIIEFFLEDQNIKYQREVEIKSLQNDSRKYRKADFYLPKFKVYIEFLGRWNISPEAKNEYKEKKDAYLKNNIPCIYIYPENLGAIDLLFRLRMRELFDQRPDMKTEQRLYNFWRLKQKLGILNNLWLILFFGLLLLENLYNQRLSVGFLPAIISIVFVLGLSIYVTIQIFSKTK